jgi:Flp pilus assembly protein TadG
MKAKREARSSRGAVALEFALFVPVLLLLIAAAIDYGWCLYVIEVTGNAAREGARAGTLYTALPKDDAAATQDAHDTAVAYLTSVGLSNCAVAQPTTGNLNGSVSIIVNVTCPLSPNAGQPSLSGFLRPPLIPTGAVARAEMRR